VLEKGRKMYIMNILDSVAASVLVCHLSNVPSIVPVPSVRGVMFDYEPRRVRCVTRKYFNDFFDQIFGTLKLRVIPLRIAIHLEW